MNELCEEGFHGQANGMHHDSHSSGRVALVSKQSNERGGKKAHHEEPAVMGSSDSARALVNQSPHSHSSSLPLHKITHFQSSFYYLIEYLEREAEFFRIEEDRERMNNRHNGMDFQENASEAVQQEGTDGNDGEECDDQSTQHQPPHSLNPSTSNKKLLLAHPSSLALLNDSLHFAKLALNELLDQRDDYLTHHDSGLFQVTKSSPPPQDHNGSPATTASATHSVQTRAHQLTQQKYIRSILSIQYHIIHILQKMHRFREANMWQYQSEIVYEEYKEVLEIDFGLDNSHYNGGGDDAEATQNVHAHSPPNMDALENDFLWDTDLDELEFSHELHDVAQPSAQQHRHVHYPPIHSKVSAQLHSQPVISTTSSTSSSIPSLPDIKSPATSLDNMQEMLQFEMKRTGSQISKLISIGNGADATLKTKSKFESPMMNIRTQYNPSSQSHSPNQANDDLVIPGMGFLEEPQITTPQSTQQEGTSPLQTHGKPSRHQDNRHLSPLSSASTPRSNKQSPKTPRVNSYHWKSPKEASPMLSTSKTAPHQHYYPTTKNPSPLSRDSSSHKKKLVVNMLKPMPPSSPRVNASPRTSLGRAHTSPKRRKHKPKWKNINPLKSANRKDKREASPLSTSPIWGKNYNPATVYSAKSNLTDKFGVLHQLKSPGRKLVHAKKRSKLQIVPKVDGNEASTTTGKVPVPPQGKPSNVAPRRSLSKHSVGEQLHQRSNVDKSVHTGPRRVVDPSLLEAKGTQTDPEVDEKHTMATGSVEDEDMDADAARKASFAEQKRGRFTVYKGSIRAAEGESPTFLLSDTQKRLRKHLEQYDTKELRAYLKPEELDAKNTVLCAVLAMQSFWRQQREKQARSTQTDHVRQVQRGYRSLIQQSSLKCMRDAATNIQSAWRGHKGREWYKQNQSARTIQMAYKCKKSKEMLSEKKQQNQAATKIQSLIRGSQARSRTLEKKKQHESAVIIQRSFRSKRSRATLAEKKRRDEACKVIQRSYRLRLARVETEKRRRQHQAHSAAVVLQRLWHRYYFWKQCQDSRKLREQILQGRKRAALEIQRVFRGHVARQRLTRLNHHVHVLTRCMRQISSRQFLLQKVVKGTT